MSNQVARDIADMAAEGYDDKEIREECAERAAEAGVSADELYRTSERVYAHVYEDDDSVTMVDG
jgi:hypothetical protein